MGHPGWGGYLRTGETGIVCWQVIGMGIPVFGILRDRSIPSGGSKNFEF